MRALLLPCLAVCSLALSGCSAVYSAHPLNTKEDAVEVPALRRELGRLATTTIRTCASRNPTATRTA